MNPIAMAAAVAVVVLLGCGGGGAGGGSSTTLTGFAAKGTLQWATVTAYAVEADGTVSTKPALPAVQTDADGMYTLPGLAADQQVVVKVTTNASTRHVDEVIGTNAGLSSAFVLSALPTRGSGNSTVSITPFSHQMMVAAQNAPGGLSRANIASAKAVVQELIGFDPVSIAHNNGSSAPAKQLKVLLTAVSQMAANGDLGCAAAADKTACVTRQLAEATRIDTLKLSLGSGSSAVDVSAVFKSAVRSAVVLLGQNDSSISPALMANVLSKLSCEGSGCVPTSAATGGSPLDQAKAVTSEVHADLNTLFSADGVTNLSQGQLTDQAFKFKPFVEAAQADIDQRYLDLQALALGMNLYKSVKAGSSTSLSAGTAAGQLRFAVNVAADQLDAASCTLFQDGTLATPARNAAEANFLGCSARYARTASYQLSTGRTQYAQWQHHFTLVPSSVTAGKFAYRSRALQTSWDCAGQPTQNGNGEGTAAYACSDKTATSLQKDSSNADLVFQGEVVAAASSGPYQELVVTGNLPANFQLVRNSSGWYDLNAVALMSNATRAAWNLAATFDPVDASGQAKVALHGDISSYQGSAKVADLTLNSGSYVDKINQRAQLETTLRSYSTGQTSALTGTLVLGAGLVPTQAQFTGVLTNTSTGGTAEFIKGVLDMQIGDNSDVALTFKGSKTAADQSRLDMVLETVGKSYNFNDTARTVNLSYSRWTGSTKTRAVSMTLERTLGTANTPSSQTATFFEASSGLTMRYAAGDKTLDVLAGGAKVGVLDLDKRLVTFTNGSTTALHLGW